MTSVATDPAGVATAFLFSDIEGSTRRWEEHPAQMRVALQRHDRLFRDVMEGHGGDVFKHTGDGMAVAFGRVEAAVEAAGEAQRVLAAEPWEEVGGLRVRIGIHVGVAERRGADYFGRPLNRAVRVMDAGHGGQVLLSGAAARTVAGVLPPGVELEQLGEYRLPDLDVPESLAQVLFPGLRHEFPELRTLEARPNNLPIQVASFIGREQELEEVGNLLAVGRLLTLTGVGGVGKTRLALQAAAEALYRYPDGVWLVELAPITDPEHLAGAVAAALGVAEDPGRSAEEAVIDHIAEHELLLLFDNCEHLIDAAAKLAEAMLRACPHLTILATSREALAVSGEALWRVPSLSMPGDVTAEAAGDFDAVHLFVDRARLVRPDFALDDGNAADVSQICRRLDGIPLAIELAAARLKVLPVHQVAARLDDRFRLLTGGSRTALPRQRTLAAAMDWSHDLLGPSEQIMLRRLSVFQGGFTLAAAESVCSGDEIDANDVLDLIGHLVDSSMVVLDEGAVRYRLLETVRQYAADKLLAAGEGESVRLRHAEYFLEFSDAPDVVVFAGPAQIPWLERLDTEHDNLRAAILWALDSGHGDLAVRYTAILGPFWWRRGHQSEGRQCVLQVLELDLPPSRQLARTLGWAATLAVAAGDSDEGLRLAEREEAMALDLSDDLTLARAHSTFAEILGARDELHAAAARYRRSFELLRDAGNPAASIPLTNLAFTMINAGDHAGAEALTSEVRQFAPDASTAEMLVSLLEGVAAFFRGDDVTAERRITESRDIMQAIGDLPSLTLLDQVMGWVFLVRGDLDAARKAADASRDAARDMGLRDGEAQALLILAGVGVARDDLDFASARLAEVLALEQGRNQTGFNGYLFLFAVVAERRARHEDAARLVASMRAWQRGVGIVMPVGIEVKIVALERRLEDHFGQARWQALLAEAEELDRDALLDLGGNVLV